MSDDELDRLQALYLLALGAALRGPSVRPPTAAEREADRNAAADVRAARRDLNGYRPAAWDEVHP